MHTENVFFLFGPTENELKFPKLTSKKRYFHCVSCEQNLLIPDAELWSEDALFSSSCSAKEM